MIAMIIAATVGVAFVSGIIIGNRMPVPITDSFALAVADSPDTVAEITAPVPGETFTFYEEIPLEADLPPERESREVMRITTTPMPGQPPRPDGPTIGDHTASL